VSDGERERWRRKQDHYQDPAVVERYDVERFAAGHAARSTEKKWRAVLRGLGGEWEGCRSVLDVPCGTGRFASNLVGAGKWSVGADLSAGMLSKAREKGAEHVVRTDALRLGFADASFDVVMSIRFLFHVPRELRVEVLREFGRVARRFVVVDVRHRYCWSAWARRVRAVWTKERVPFRYSVAEVEEEFEKAGLEVVRKVWLAPGLSEKMVVVARRKRA